MAAYDSLSLPGNRRRPTEHPPLGCLQIDVDGVPYVYWPGLPPYLAKQAPDARRGFHGRTWDDSRKGVHVATYETVDGRLGCTCTAPAPCVHARTLAAAGLIGGRAMVTTPRD